MNYQVMRKWVKALRSGKYEQTEGKLMRSEDNKFKYCCLGVLCKITEVSFRGNIDSLLPDEAIVKSGMKDRDGGLPKEYACKNNAKSSNLAELNDNGLSFKQIANIIEKNWRFL